MSIRKGLRRDQRYREHHRISSSTRRFMEVRRGIDDMCVILKMLSAIKKLGDWALCAGAVLVIINFVHFLLEFCLRSRKNLSLLLLILLYNLFLAQLNPLTVLLLLSKLWWSIFKLSSNCQLLGLCKVCRIEGPPIHFEDKFNKH